MLTSTLLEHFCYCFGEECDYSSVLKTVRTRMNVYKVLHCARTVLLLSTFLPWLKSCGLFLRVILVKKYVLLVSTGQTKKISFSEFLLLCESCTVYIITSIDG